MQNLPSPYQSFSLPELQHLLKLRLLQKDIINSFLSCKAPERVCIVVWGKGGFSQLTFDKELYIPPEFSEFFASLFDRVQGEIWLLEAAIEKLAKLN